MVPTANWYLHPNCFGLKLVLPTRKRTLVSLLGNRAGTRTVGSSVCAFCHTGIVNDHDVPQMLVPWFHALDHTHYARWIPVHLKDMAKLTTKHTDVARKFREGQVVLFNPD